MIKFVIGSIALIFVVLAVYVYTGEKSEEVSKSVVTHEVVKDKANKRETVEVVNEVSSQTKPTVKKDKLLVENTYNTEEETLNSEDGTGKGLTLESIENADVSDEEKERMVDYMIYQQSLNMEPSEPLSEEEILNIIEQDLKNGLIQ